MELLCSRIPTRSWPSFGANLKFSAAPTTLIWLWHPRASQIFRRTQPRVWQKPAKTRLDLPEFWPDRPHIRAKLLLTAEDSAERSPVCTGSDHEVGEHPPSQTWPKFPGRRMEFSPFAASSTNIAKAYRYSLYVQARATGCWPSRRSAIDELSARRMPAGKAVLLHVPASSKVPLITPNRPRRVLKLPQWYSTQARGRQGFIV